MRQLDMEDAIRNLDRRLSTVEQILPTLATKEDVRAATAGLASREELYSAIQTATDQLRKDVREDIQTATDQLRQELRQDIQTATDQLRQELRQDIQTSAEQLREEIADTRRRSDILIEDLRDDVVKVAEGVAFLAGDVAATKGTLEQLVTRLEARGVI